MGLSRFARAMKVPYATKTWVAVGDPIAPSPEQARVAERFLRSAERCGCRVLWLAASLPWAQDSSMPRLRVGQEPLWDPAAWSGILAKKASLRAQLRRGRAARLSTETVSGASLVAAHPLRVQVDELANQWLQAKAMRPLGFLAALHLWSLRAHKTLVLVWKDRAPSADCAQLVAVAVLVDGFVEHVMRHPDAPNGAVELLIDRVMQEAKVRGWPQLSLGGVPLMGPVPTWLARLGSLCSPCYSFDGLVRFRGKFVPTEVRDLWLLHPHHRFPAHALAEAMMPFLARG